MIWSEYKGLPQINKKNKWSYIKMIKDTDIMIIHKKHYAAAKSLQSCLTLWYPIDGRPPGSPVPGILQARTLEWVAISFSKETL